MAEQYGLGGSGDGQRQAFIFRSLFVTRPPRGIQQHDIACDMAEMQDVETARDFFVSLGDPQVVSVYEANDQGSPGLHLRTLVQAQGPVVSFSTGHHRTAPHSDAGMSVRRLRLARTPRLEVALAQAQPARQADEYSAAPIVPRSLVAARLPVYLCLRNLGYTGSYYMERVYQPDELDEPISLPDVLGLRFSDDDGRRY